VLEEIPRVRKDLGYIPLVTPTSQIVGTQAVLNVLLGERYKNIAKETQAILRGEYGLTPQPVDKALQAKVLEPGKSAITCRPADLIEPELDALTAELDRVAKEKHIQVRGIDDVLTYALFPQIGLRFLDKRGDASAFEPPPDPNAAAKAAPATTAANDGPERYQVAVNGRNYDVIVSPGGAVTDIAPVAAASSPPAAPTAAPPTGASEAIKAPLAGNIFKVLVKVGQQVTSGEILVIMEAMKMETEVRAPRSGTISSVDTKEGDTIELGQSLVQLA
jgi:oxaloacetate decarboxylase alpha subunit